MALLLKAGARSAALLDAVVEDAELVDATDCLKFSLIEENTHYEDVRLMENSFVVAIL